MKTRAHFLLHFHNLVVDVVRLSNAGEAFSIRRFTVTDISQSTEDILVISAIFDLKFRQYLVYESIVSVNTVVAFWWQPFSLHLLTYKGLKVA